MSGSCSSNSRINPVLFFLIAGLVIFPSLSYLIYGQQDVSVYKERLKRIQQERERLKIQIGELDKTATSILSQLDKIGFEKRLIQNDIAKYNLQMRRANSELSAIQKQIPPLKAKLEKEKASVAKILVTLYKFGDMNYLDFLFRAENMTDIMSESKHLTLLAQYQEKIVLSFIQTLKELREAEEQAEAKKQEIADLLARAREKKKELDTQEINNRVFIRQISQDRKMFLKTLEELEVRAEQLQKLIDGLIKEKASLPFPIVPLYDKKGSLPWPVSGTIVTTFGIERHPQFKTETQNNGIEISTQEDTVIKAIHPGKVVYADYFQGFYGNLIIIDHGLSYYSMYGHCSEFRVKKGDIVDTGQTIAVVGDTGSLKGTALYFQINFQTEPKDPLQWLKRR